MYRMDWFEDDLKKNYLDIVIIYSWDDKDLHWLDSRVNTTNSRLGKSDYIRLLIRDTQMKKICVSVNIDKGLCVPRDLLLYSDNLSRSFMYNLGCYKHHTCKYFYLHLLRNCLSEYSSRYHH